MPKTDPEIRGLGLEQPADDVESIVEIGRIAGAWRDDYAIWFDGFNVCERRSIGNDRDASAAIDERLDNVSFDAAIEYDDVRPISVAVLLHLIVCYFVDDISLARQHGLSSALNQLLI